jgi:hypothetical protein
MSYCTLADVEALNAQRTPYSASTRPADGQVEDFIADIASEIDSVLSAAGLAVPVLAPAAFVSFLQRLNAYGAAALAEMAKFPESDRGQGSSPQGDRYWSLYREGIKALKDRSAIHAGAVRASTGPFLARSYRTDNPDGLTAEQLAPALTMRDVY